MKIKKMDIDYGDENIEGNNSDLVNKLNNLNGEIDKIDRERNLLSSKKDAIIGMLKERASGFDNFYRKVIYGYLETMDISIVAHNMGIPEELVKGIVDKFLQG